jgi:hypothetical protein
MKAPNSTTDSNVNGSLFIYNYTLIFLVFYFGRHNITTLLTCENASGFNYGLNSEIVDEITNYYNLPQSLLFTEGNFYILNKDIVLNKKVILDIKRENNNIINLLYYIQSKGKEKGHVTTEIINLFTKFL